MTAKLRTTLELFCLFAISLLLFTYGLYGQEIVGFESRFYLFAQEMQQTGSSWFPTTYQQPYPDYPATATLFIYLSAALFGGLNKFTAVLPTAIAAAITVILTYCIGCLHSKRWGVAGVCFLALSITFLHDARSLALDMFPTMITAGCFYLLCLAETKQYANCDWWLLPLFALGFIFRGPIGLVIPAGVMCIYYLIDQNFKKLFIRGLLALVLLVVCTSVLLLLARQTGGDKFMQAVLRMQIMGRMQGAYQSAHFYFTNGMGAYAASFPLALFVMLGVGYYYFIARVTVVDAKFLLKLFGWMMVIVCGMSVPGDKKIRYILPMVPAAALLSAYLFAVVPTEKYFKFWRGLLSALFWFFPLILLVMVEVIYFYTTNNNMNLHISYIPLALFLGVMQLVNFWFFYQRDQLRDMHVLIVATVAFVVAYIAAIEHFELYLERARDFVTAVESQRNAEHARLVFYRERPDGLAIKYFINMPQREKPDYIFSQKQLVEFKKPAFFVTNLEYFDALPPSVLADFTIIASDKLGHTRVVVFKRKW